MMPSKTEPRESGGGYHHLLGTVNNSVMRHSASSSYRSSATRTRGMNPGMRHDGDGDDGNSSGGESDLGHGQNVGGGGGLGHGGDDGGGDMDSKRKRRLELNRKAAKESRRRKKMRIEELGRSVVFLTRENQELREQNELLRQMLAADVPPETNSALSKFQAENAALRLALFETVKQDMVGKSKDGRPEDAHQQHQHQAHLRPKDSPSGGAEGAGAHGGGGGLSLADHPRSGPLPSLAIGPAHAAPSSSQSLSSSSLPLLSSLPPLPPPAGLAGAAGGEYSTLQHQGQTPHHGGGGSPSMMLPSSSTSSSLHRHDNNGSNSNNYSGNHNENRGESMLDVSGGGSALGGNSAGNSNSANGAGSGSRALSGVPGMAGSYVGSGLNVMANIAGGVVSRERDGTSGVSSGQVGGRAPAPPPSLGGYHNGGVSTGYGDQGGGYSGSTPVSLLRNKNSDRGSAGASASTGGNGNGGAGGLGSSGISDFITSEMAARASSNAAMLRQRGMQQPAGGQREEGATAGAGGGSTRGGWPTASWQPSRDSMSGAGGTTTTTSNLERDL